MVWWFLSGLAGSILTACAYKFRDGELSRGVALKCFLLMVLGPIILLFCVFLCAILLADYIYWSPFWSKRLW